MLTCQPRDARGPAEGLEEPPARNFVAPEPHQRQCAEQGIDVQVIPGPCAAIAALAVSGLPTQQFCFEGFLAVSGKTRREHLERLRGETRTMIFYEAPHKLLRTSLRPARHVRRSRGRSRSRAS